MIAVYPPKSGYPSAEAPYFDLELQFFGSCCHTSQDRVLWSSGFVQHSMEYVWKKTTETVVNNFVPRKNRRR